ncbi:DUF3750 domain-containing protein [Halomonas desiderata]|uniref:DUF3750 domain-containing protein n=1 Tax=Billgrantia desiderata TaxID=52021 RepID=A0AAW4YQE6_9GAMM|nr:DUF3750 domain-containing protein [Halomonas desiderata]MCE8010848.1 DUF3750 domain-containing protein [Halomonas desiderata]MCE8051114.1 DUF3750 domain-containing protein [Halomonas desiderata]NIC35343.1 DUF3750 domain-containing protein [Halomonas desiderata]
MRKLSLGLLLLTLLLIGGPLYMWQFGGIDTRGDWRSADRSPVGLAPAPSELREAVVQIYSARAFNWRGIFAVHAWVATKPANADSYTLHQVTGWGRPALTSRAGTPDRAWFGSAPTLHATLCGSEAESAIARIEALLPEYPYREHYRAWPGPNSNTFVAWLIREVPELDVALPSSAIGKDYLGGSVLAATPSGTGVQLSLAGMLGAAAGLREGLELNIGGLVLGIDPAALGVKLPGVGTLGLRDGGRSRGECPPLPTVAS